MEVKTLKYVNMSDINCLNWDEKDKLLSHWESTNGTYRNVSILDCINPSDYDIKHNSEVTKILMKFAEKFYEEFPGDDCVAIKVDW